MNFNKLIPELSVTNIDKSKEFYLKLGFKIMYERKKDKFAFLELEGNQLMIEEINDNWNTGKLEYPFGRGINISMTINDIDKYYQELVNKNIIFFKDIMTNEYDVNGKTYLDKEFLIQDPDGYLLRFNN
ncbi:MAG TPA: VOC family protein [Candidatus Onthousia excrementipullorum]|uniref:Bleomycin resistance protein n=1 Tax=Candidatus Onthousia excrementipullorum TaxID=2840884 RepID=A0A9D1DT00_9FIRM|nr:VOC family protein [Candidatus Onthousia excrementipullorum]